MLRAHPHSVLVEQRHVVHPRSNVAGDRREPVCPVLTLGVYFQLRAGDYLLVRVLTEVRIRSTSANRGVEGDRCFGGKRETDNQVDRLNRNTVAMLTALR